MKNLGKLILTSFVATLCLSAAPAIQKDQEISMMKCTRDSSSADMQDSGCQSDSQQSDDNCEKPVKEKKPRKSAAKCVMDGE